jgi:AbrB family looped-hinge helix DNA binding protein
MQPTMWRYLCHIGYGMAKDISVTTTVAQGGRIVIPASYRRALGVRPGDQIVLRFEDGEVRITSRAQARRRAREYVRSLAPKGTSLVNELIRERRESAND